MLSEGLAAQQHILGLSALSGERALTGSTERGAKAAPSRWCVR